MINELTQALRDMLLADSTLTAMLHDASAVYEGLPPSGAKRPYIIIGASPITDDNSTPRETREATITVNATADSMRAANDIQERVRQLINDSDIILSGASIFWSRSDHIITYRDTLPTRETIAHAAGSYTIRLQTA